MQLAEPTSQEQSSQERRPRNQGAAAEAFLCEGGSGQHCVLAVPAVVFPQLCIMRSGTALVAVLLTMTERVS